MGDESFIRTDSTKYQGTQSKTLLALRVVVELLLQVGASAVSNPKNVFLLRFDVRFFLSPVKPAVFVVS